MRSGSSVSPVPRLTRQNRCALASAGCGGRRARKGSAHSEAATAGLVELLGLGAVRPGALVVLLREVAGAVAGQEGLADLLGVALVARAPGSGGDVHDIAPTLLVL